MSPSRKTLPIVPLARVASARTVSAEAVNRRDILSKPIISNFDIKLNDLISDKLNTKSENDIVNFIIAKLISIFSDKYLHTLLVSFPFYQDQDQDQKKNNILRDIEIIKNYLTTPATLATQRLSGGKCKKTKSQKGGALSAQALHILIPMLIIITALVLYLNDIVDPTVCRTVKFRLFGYFYGSLQKEYCKYYYQIYKVYDKLLNDLQSIQMNSHSGGELLTNLSTLFLDLGKLITASYAFIFTYTKFVNTLGEFTANPLGAVGVFASKITDLPNSIAQSFTIITKNTDELKKNEAEANFGNHDGPEEELEEHEEEAPPAGGKRKRKTTKPKPTKTKKPTKIKKTKAYKAKAI